PYISFFIIKKSITSLTKYFKFYFPVHKFCNFWLCFWAPGGVENGGNCRELAALTSTPPPIQKTG
ncbi:MAG: hypothetical protein WC310_05795, partial [Patescibacteria group bacterium]